MEIWLVLRLGLKCTVATGMLWILQMTRVFEQIPVDLKALGKYRRCRVF